MVLSEMPEGTDFTFCGKRNFRLHDRNYLTFVVKTSRMNIESEENVMETLDLKVLEYENDDL